MEDMERYGDYNEQEEEAVPAQKNVVLTCIKYLLILVIVAVIALLGCRLFLFDYYPKAAKQLVMTESLRAYYDRTDGDVRIQKQDLRFPYDDIDLVTINSNDLGTFFADHLYVIDAIGELQITARVNTAGLESIGALYGIDADADTIAAKLTFRLTDNYGRVYDELVYCEMHSYAMYRYYKLAFDGIAFASPDDGQGAPEWIRMEILLEGEETPYSYMLIYENNEDFSTFTEYKPSSEEVAP